VDKLAKEDLSLPSNRLLSPARPTDAAAPDADHEPPLVLQDARSARR
jgi:hypothetical protein